MVVPLAMQIDCVGSCVNGSTDGSADGYVVGFEDNDHTGCCTYGYATVSAFNCVFGYKDGCADGLSVLARSWEKNNNQHFVGLGTKIEVRN